MLGVKDVSVNVNDSYTEVNKEIKSLEVKVSEGKIGKNNREIYSNKGVQIFIFIWLHTMNSNEVLFDDNTH